jgi:hypothetical protein
MLLDGKQKKKLVWRIFSHNGFFKGFVKEVGGEYAQLASEIKEDETYVDTGSYIFNALVSGSIFGGVSGNKITGLVGESSVEKLFMHWQLLKTS